MWEERISPWRGVIKNPTSPNGIKLLGGKTKILPDERQNCTIQSNSIMRKGWQQLVKAYISLLIIMLSFLCRTRKYSNKRIEEMFANII